MKLSFSEVARSWKDGKRLYIKDSTYATYVYHVNNLLLPAFGGGARPSESQIQAFVNRQLQRGLSAKTMRDSLIVLKMILRYGERSGAWRHFYFEVHFPPARMRTAPPQVLSGEQQLRLFRYLGQHPSARNLGLQICLFSGMRIGEICALQWRDIDISGRLINVRKTVRRIWLKDGGQVINRMSVGTPKTASSVRDIPISQQLLRIIRTQYSPRPGSIYIVSDGPEPLEPRYYRDYFHKLLRMLGLPPVRFHALRHSFATHCIASKCDYKTVSAILGHSSLSTTMDLYVHPGDADKRRCIERMSKLWLDGGA